MKNLPLNILLGLAVVGTCATVLTTPSDCQAQRRSGIQIDRPHTGDRPLQLDLHAGYTWWGRGFATGVRFGIPIVKNGFVPSINNAVYINFGADLYFVGYNRGRNDFRGVGLAFPVALHWEFYFNDHWSAFAELGVNVYIFHPRYFNDDDFFIDPGPWFLAAVGGRFHLNEHIAFTGRVGNPYVSGGVTFLF